ncbi:hypothetical protein CJU78_25055, partial [Pseudomonas fragi]
KPVQGAGEERGWRIAQRFRTLPPLRAAQTSRGSAPEGLQGSESLRDPPPSFLPCALDGLVSKIHPRARPAKPDQPAF